MKKLLILAGLALSPLVANAQSTNVYYVLTIEEGTTRTNQFTNQFASIAVKGLNVSYQSYQAASTNNTQTFRQYSKDYVKTLVEVPLKDLGRNYEMSQQSVDKIMMSIAANWDNASAADRKLLTDWLAKYPAQ